MSHPTQAHSAATAAAACEQGKPPPHHPTCSTVFECPPRVSGHGRLHLQRASTLNAARSRSIPSHDEASQANGEATQRNVSRSAPGMTSPKKERSSYDTHNAGSRSPAPSASDITSSSTRAIQHASSAVVAAAPASRTFFDPWNSSSTGHQRAENRLAGSTSWRVSRNLKLSKQYQGGLTGGGKRVADTVGAGSRDFGKDGRKANGGWEKGAKGLRTGGQQSITEAWGASKAGKHMSKGKDEVNEVRSEQVPSHSDHSDEDLDYQQGMSLCTSL